MFNLFRKKDRPFPVIDQIWMTVDAKYRAMRSRVETEPGVLFIFWFERSYEQALSYFGGETQSPNLVLAREVLHSPVSERRLIFAEHHPLLVKEKETFERLKLERAEVWSALDEPLLKKFGGQKIMGMMEKLGMKADEIIEHPLISSSIRKAQEKIAKKVMLDSHSSSMEEWFERNFPG